MILHDINVSGHDAIHYREKYCTLDSLNEITTGRQRTNATYFRYSIRHIRTWVMCSINGCCLHTILSSSIWHGAILRNHLSIAIYGERWMKFHRAIKTEIVLKTLYSRSFAKRTCLRNSENIFVRKNFRAPTTKNPKFATYLTVCWLVRLSEMWNCCIGDSKRFLETI